MTGIKWNKNLIVGGNMKNKALQKIIKEIDPERWYRPMEIAKAGWIRNAGNKGDYYYVLKLIKRGRLRARDFGLGKTPYYRVLGSEIIRYLESIY